MTHTLTFQQGQKLYHCTSSACHISSTSTESADFLLSLLSLVHDTQRLSKDFLK